MLICLILILLISPLLSADDVFSVNKIIGDLSFKEKYSSSPLSTSSELLRIQVHLEYAELFIRRRIQNNNK